MEQQITQDIQKPLLDGYSQADQHPPKKFSKLAWLSFPVISVILFGCSQYMIATAIRLTNDVRYQYAQGIGFPVAALSFHTSYFIYNQVKQEPYCGKYKQIFYKQSGHFNSLVLITLLGRVITQALTLKFMALVSYYAVLAGTSPAIMMSITATSGIFTALVYYFWKNEQLSRIQIVSIVILTIAVIPICFSKQFQSSTTEIGDEDTNEISIIVPVMLALILTILGSLNQILAKITLSNGYNALLYTADFMFLQAFTILPFFIFEQMRDPFQLFYVIFVIIQSCFFFAGQVFQNIGLKYGKIGLNTAIIQNYSAVQFLFEVIFDQRKPMILEIVGLSLTIIGISVNAFKK